jgi:hypothetical protein
MPMTHSELSEVKGIPDSFPPGLMTTFFTFDSFVARVYDTSYVKGSEVTTQG